MTNAVMAPDLRRLPAALTREPPRDARPERLRWRRAAGMRSGCRIESRVAPDRLERSGGGPRLTTAGADLRRLPAARHA